ncbi:MAG: polynucleotide adenylyltransferase PcnB [Spirochaetales bacterium]|uniref:Polynucleotide adenylyltransferase PcnB n=1 Tax=Candidatus Thalassospirochaeta sargassi TaxID=3119039 RepID=A0AAJ1MN80_9SPIO|nr:polynucleotide adenylyltransferase PcnB [Spirochaetales bacterium]
MLIRYGTNGKGRRVKIANIYTIEEHGITTGMIDSDALKIIKRLRHAGYNAYVVGGAVRDLLLNKTPKDFDIATDAHPRQIKKLFYNAKIIGKRFRLVHIQFQNKIIEVSTFRGLTPGDEQNTFGTIEDDVKRRDFSFNALYYSPVEEQLLDYIGGYDDVKQGRIRSLIPLDVTFKEDPVRLIRTVKYASTTGFQLPGKIKKALKKYSSELDRAAVSRLTEELMKILACGSSNQIFRYCMEYDMLKYIVPVIASNATEEMMDSLVTLDSEILERHGVKREYMLYALTRTYLNKPTESMIKTKTAFREVFKEMKAIIAPLTPPNIEVEKAVVLYFKELGISVRIPNQHSNAKYRRGGKRRRPQHRKGRPAESTTK